MCSSSLSPQITIQTRITPRSKRLIDNIFTNSAGESSISGNLSYSISDQLAKSDRKQDTFYKRNYNKDNLSNLKNELQNIDWLNILKTNRLKIINALLGKHTLKKPMTKKKLKARSKPWLKSGILTSIKNKNEIYNKFCKAKDQTRKQHLHEKLKSIGIP